jgi:hypothetical protein
MTHLERAAWQNDTWENGIHRNPFEQVAGIIRREKKAGYILRVVERSNDVCPGGRNDSL